MKMTKFVRTGRWLVAAVAALSCFWGGGSAQAQIEFERAPILYLERPGTGPVAELATKLERGELKLEHTEGHGYLESVLRELDISPSSQVLVFSKTSFQLSRITPRRPRAIYFNDDTYVGWVQHGDVIEMSTADPQLGGVFYTLDLTPSDRPKLIRDKGTCLTCHASSRTQGVPGHLVRSVFTAPSGQPHFGAGTFTSDQRSPFEERWGGWYVSGTHGSMRHMGNVVAQDKDRPEQLDRDAGANVTDLSTIVDVSPYLSPSSDIVALMVLEHQSQMHNYITLAHYEAVQAKHYDEVMNRALERPMDHESDLSKRRVDGAAEKLVRYLLMCDEFRLEAPVAGGAQFAADFSQRGPRDRQGRSLRDFDLQRRLFKYPCSYLIYSSAFDGLPATMKKAVATKLKTALTGPADAAFAHLGDADRRAIFEILRDTKPELFE